MRTRKIVLGAAVTAAALALVTGSLIVAGPAAAGERGAHHHGHHFWNRHHTGHRSGGSGLTPAPSTSAPTRPTVSAHPTPIAPASTSTASTPTPTATPHGSVTPRTPGPVPASPTPPPVNGRFDYQIGGPYRPAAGVSIVDRDRTEAPVAGAYNICYINGFQTQPGESGDWPAAVVTSAEDPGWPGEFVVDTSSAASRAQVAAVVDQWIDGCKAAGYQAVEIDNLDSFTRSAGALTAADNLAAAKLFADHAHGVGLAVAQKNGSDLAASAKASVGFDFAIAEECQQYTECDAYTDVYGDHVIEIEYTDNKASDYTAACAARGSRISVVLRDRDVVPAGADGYRYESC